MIAQRNQNRRILLFFIFGMIVATRLLIVNRPLLGNFASRQIPYAMAAESYLNGAKLLLPETLNLVSGKPTFMLLDFPLISLLAAGLHSVTHFPVDASGRLISCLATLGTGILLFFFTRKLYDEETALFAVFALAFSPLSIIYGQSFQQDALSVMLAVGTLHFFLEWLESKNLFFLGLAAFSFSIAVLIRIQSPYLLLPLLLLALSKEGWRFLKSKGLWIAFILACIPPLAWYWHTYQATLQYDNIIWSPFHQLEVHRFPHPLLFQFIFYLKLAKTLFYQAFNPLVTVLFFCGLVSARKKPYSLFLFSWLIAVLITFVILPRKIFDHNYYALQIVPVGAVFIGLACRNLKKGSTFWIFAFCLLFGISFFVSFKPLYFVPVDERNVVNAGREIRALTDSKSRIIYRANSSALIYYTGRYGWNFSLRGNNLSPWISQNVGHHLAGEQLEKMKSAARDPISWLEFLKVEYGATHFAVSDKKEIERNPAFFSYLKSHYRLLLDHPDCVLVDLVFSREV